MKEIIREVYEMLQARQIHPRGTFDNAGRFILDNANLVKVRAPSKRWPYSHMVAGRTLIYVNEVTS